MRRSAPPIRCVRGHSGHSAWAMMFDVDSAPKSASEFEVPGVLFRQYLIGGFAVGGDGLANAAGVHVLVTLTDRRIETPKIKRDGTVKSLSSDFPIESWNYSEVNHADVFKSPWWAKIHGITSDQLGTRLHLGESRSPVLLFTVRQDELLRGLEAHGVTVQRIPVRLNPLLVGRK